MVAARERSTYNPLYWLAGTHASPSQEEISLRQRIVDLRSPLRRMTADGKLRVVEGSAYGYWGMRFPPNHALRSPPLAEDPIFLIATLGTGAMHGQLFRLGSVTQLRQFATRHGLMRMGAGGGIGVAINGADQLIRMGATAVNTRFFPRLTDKLWPNWAINGFWGS